MSRAAVILRSTVLIFAVGASFALAPSGASALRSHGRTRPGCAPPVLAPVFSWSRDARLYSALPGESWDSMGDGSGWTLTGGARFQTASLLDGAKGSVLDLPSGSKAVTPLVCVTNDYPMARTEIRDVSGGRGVNVYVVYPAAKRMRHARFSANLSPHTTGWALPRPFSITRGDVRGWHLARFVLVPQGQRADYQLSNFYVDPRMHR